MDDSGYLIQFLYLIVYSSSLICIASVIVFRKKLETRQNKALSALLILIALSSTLISVQVFFNAVGFLDQLNENDSAKLVLFMNMLIIINIAALVHSVIQTSFALRPAELSMVLRTVVGAGAAVLLIATLIFQLLTLLTHSSPASDLLGITIISGIAGSCTVIIFSAVRLYIPFNLKSDQTGHPAVRLLLLLLFIFPSLVLISGSRIGAITAPIGFITLNIISIRIIFIKAAHPGLPDEAQSKPLPPPDPAENCRELGLSKRESEVALLLAKGCTYKELAAELFISMSTTQTHVGRIYSKLGINNKTELSNLINYQQSKI